MFKPIEFFIKDRKASIPWSDADSLKQEWSKLDERQILRYVKQAEYAYDNYVQVNEVLFL